MESLTTEKTSDKSTQPSRVDTRSSYALQVGTSVVACIAGLAIGTKNIIDDHYTKFKRGFGGAELNDVRQFIRDTVREVLLDNSIAPQERWDKVFNTVYREMPHRNVAGIEGKIFRVENMKALETALRNIELTNKDTALDGAKISSKVHQQVTTTVETWYNTNRKAIERAFGFETEGLRGKTVGLIQRFQDLSAPKRVGIGLRTAVSVGTVVGAYMLISQNQRLKSVNHQQAENMRTLADRIDAADQRRSEQYDKSAASR